MSTDLESRQDLPRIQVRAVKTETLQSCSATDDKETIIQQENSETDDCQTPKSEEHKIPVVLSCPPAPRKPRRSFSCKRKLTELEFFEIVNREEVDSFFQSSFELLPKRRCPCIWNGDLVYMYWKGIYKKNLLFILLVFIPFFPFLSSCMYE